MELVNTIAQAFQSFFIIGAGVTILVVAVRGGRTLGSIQEQLKGITKDLGDYVERNDDEHRSMQGRIGKVETRTARLEGASSRRNGS